MKLQKVVLSLACAAVSCMVPSMASAQGVYFNGIGSSNLFETLGNAAYHLNSSSCSWTAASSAGFSAKDAGPSPALSNSGQIFIVWTPGTSGTCSAPTASSRIYSYLQVDSAVGNRCVFRTPANATEGCTLNVGTVGTGANLLVGITDTPTLPAAIQNALFPATPLAFGVAGSDVRPEDSQFAIFRAEQPKSVTLGGQYAGEGYGAGGSTVVPSYPSTTDCGTIAITGSTAPTKGGGGSVAAALFSLPGSGAVDPCTGTAAVTSFNAETIGASPVIVIVNKENASGFGASTVKNINLGELAGFLDGDLCTTTDLSPRAYSAAGAAYATTFVREPFSGTYNTIEYAAPSSRAVGKSQEYPVSDPTTQPLDIVSCHLQHGSFQRTTSTGNEIAAVNATTDALGYAFYTVGNFTATGNTSALPNGKYLTVDGVDPIQNSYSNGCPPYTSGTGTCQTAFVNYSHVADGTYPIWSTLRLVITSQTPGTQVGTVAALISEAQTLLSSRPDFLGKVNLNVLHSHFVPPVTGTNIGTTIAANSNATSCTTAEAGGDVAGVVITSQSNGDYCTDFGLKTGLTGERK